MESDLEAKFDYYWRVLNGPPVEHEYRFHPTRRWRFDRCDHSAMVAIELDGGTFSQGRHSRGAGYSADCEKLNTATAMGWRVFRLTSDMLDNPQKHIRPIIEFIRSNTP